MEEVRQLEKETIEHWLNSKKDERDKDSKVEIKTYRKMIKIVEDAVDTLEEDKQE